MEKPQDFTRKFVIALHENLASWQLTNTVGHIAAYLGNKLENDFDTGEYFKTKDDKNLPRNSQYAVVALKASEADLKNLSETLEGGDMLHIVYIQEMIDMIDDNELAESIKNKSHDEMNILGIGIFGTKEELKLLTGKLSLWK